MSIYRYIYAVELMVEFLKNMFVMVMKKTGVPQLLSKYYINTLTGSVIVLWLFE